jgi:hypothetical protein
LTTSSYPRSLTAGDFDGDTIEDFVTANGDRTLSVFLGVGDGTFRPRADYILDVQPLTVRSEDLNGDGSQDLMIGTGGLLVLLGRGDGTFGPATPVTSANMVWFAIGDLNGDSKLDVVGLTGTTFTGTTLSVLLGNGDGTFTAPTGYEAGRGARSIALADMDRDGNLDAVAVNSGCETVSIFRNLSHPPAVRTARVSFEPHTINLGNHATWLTAYLEPVGFSPSDILVASVRLAGSVVPSTKLVVVGDHDRNGKPDLTLKFLRADIDPHLVPGNNHLEVTGALLEGASFHGGDDVRVIARGNAPKIPKVSPNPWNPRSTLSFYVGAAGPVRIRLYDQGGRLVRTLLDAPALPAGSHELTMDGRGDRGATLPSGVYYYRIDTAAGPLSGRLAIVK